jgi:enamine deaminase RidA (YjgF/YER057c/UK114 family)
MTWRETVPLSRIARRLISFLLICGGLYLPLTAQEPIRAVTSVRGPNKFVSAGVEAGGYLYVSGQGPRRADGTIPSGFAAQLRQTIENVRAVVEAAGLTMDNVVYVQVYLTDMRLYREMNHAFGEYFARNPPARAVLGVYALSDPPVEISAVAARNLDDRKAVYPPNYSKEETAPPGVLTHDRLFISSMAGADPATGKVPDDPGAQVDLALDRMTAVVEAAGLRMSHVVFVNPYLTSDIPTHVMNGRYAKRFEFGNTPARATIEVSSLPGGARIEYTGVAVRDLQQRKAIRPKNMPPSPTASPCVFAGHTLYCSAKSGFIPGPHGGLYATTTLHQLRQTMRNLLDNLEEAEMDFSQVVSTSIYLDNLADAPAYNEVYGEYFAPIMPANTTVQQLAPSERKADQNDHYTELEQISLVAVRKSSH